jgi:hypothetical protein
VHELYYDDMAALSTMVHQSILFAAQQVGIDTTKLEKHEPAYSPKNRSKLRF